MTIDSGVCGELMTGAVALTNNYSKTSVISDYDLTDVFLNESNVPEYSFDKIQADIKPSYMTYTNYTPLVRTRRLRTTCIDDKYIVMSPLIVGAGEAYIDIELPHIEDSCYMSVEMSLWGENEIPNYSNEQIVIKQANWDDSWHVVDIFPASDLPVGKDCCQRFTFKTFRSDLRGPARWMISAEGATGSNHTANKGRIVIKSICVYSL